MVEPEIVPQENTITGEEDDSASPVQEDPVEKEDEEEDNEPAIAGR